MSPTFSALSLTLIFSVGGLLNFAHGDFLALAMYGVFALYTGFKIDAYVAAPIMFVVFFLLGFVMLACLWAVGGSLASRIEDLSSTTAVMQILVIVPFFASIFMTDPSPVQRALSYVPFTATRLSV